MFEDFFADFWKISLQFLGFLVNQHERVADWLLFLIQDNFLGQKWHYFYLKRVVRLDYHVKHLLASWLHHQIIIYLYWVREFENIFQFLIQRSNAEFVAVENLPKRVVAVNLGLVLVVQQRLYFYIFPEGGQNLRFRRKTRTDYLLQFWFYLNSLEQ